MVRVTSVEELLSGSERAVEPVNVGALSVFVRMLSAVEGMALAERLGKVDDTKEVLALQLSAFLCDAEGNDFVTVEQARIVAARYGRNTVTEIIKAGVRLNGYDQESVKGK